VCGGGGEKTRPGPPPRPAGGLPEGLLAGRPLVVPERALFGCGLGCEAAEALRYFSLLVSEGAGALLADGLVLRWRKCKSALPPPPPIPTPSGW
jgi:hypothetical protein